MSGIIAAISTGTLASYFTSPIGAGQGIAISAASRGYCGDTFVVMLSDALTKLQVSGMPHGGDLVQLAPLTPL